MATPRKRPLVLVVEDDPALGDVMLTALKDDGLDAKLAHDGDEAMRDVDDLSPSVMVLDLMMPKRDGFSVLRELRADGRISHLPVIVVTAIFGMSERLYATELGAADYVTKPFELDDLISRVRALLSPTARSRIRGARVVGERKTTRAWRRYPKCSAGSGSRPSGGRPPCNGDRTSSVRPSGSSTVRSGTPRTRRR